MLNRVRRSSFGWLKQLGQKQKDRQDVHALKALELMQAEEQKPVKDRNHTFTTRFARLQNFQKINWDNLGMKRFEDDPRTFKNIPRLAHGLQKVLKGGTYIDNFGIDRIYQPEEVDVDRMNLYKPPTKDARLLKIAKQANAKFIMSTSTITTTMAHLFFLLNSFRSPRFQLLSNALDNEPRKYMISLRRPITVILSSIGDGIWGVDSDKSIFEQQQTILMDLGKVMENQLTLSNQQFKKRFVKGQMTENYKAEDEHHRFLLLNNEICLRSQIDCLSYDPSGNPFVFQIKTRATSPIRYDLQNYQDYIDYELKTELGRYESFEREYYDLIRGGFIKYGFQLKIGGMDGAIVAFHNTKKIFGYEYIRTREIMNRIFGNELNSQVSFVVTAKMLTTILNYILDDIKEKYPAYRIGFYTESTTNSVFVYVQCLEEPPVDMTRFNPRSQMKDHYQYYTTKKQFKNRLLKYQFKVVVTVNGLPMFYPYLVNPGDHYEVHYQVLQHLRPSFVDYMNFLDQSSYLEKILGEFNYSGNWLRPRLQN